MADLRDYLIGGNLLIQPLYLLFEAYQVRRKREQRSVIYLLGKLERASFK
jgi:hypothetical protein